MPRERHHQVISLGPTVVALGYDPIGQKFLKKANDRTGSAVPQFKLYEKSSKGAKD